MNLAKLISYSHINTYTSLTAQSKKLTHANLILQRLLFSKPRYSNEFVVAENKDEKHFVCYHPEPCTPYEHSKPLTRNIEELQQAENILKVQYTENSRGKLQSESPTDVELMSIFNKPRNFWRPRPRKRFAKPNPPKDRESI